METVLLPRSMSTEVGKIMAKKNVHGTSHGEALDTIPNAGIVRGDRLKGRAELIAAITGLPQITGLIVLAVESILLTALYKSEPSDPLRIWYVLAALTCFVLLLIVLVTDRYLLREKVATRDAVREAAVDQALGSLAKQLSARYGISAELTSIRVEILDLTGKALITRLWRGICVSSEFQIPYLPGNIWVDSPGQITSPAKLLDFNLVHSRKVIRLIDVKTEADGTKGSFKFEIVGGLYASDGSLDYNYESEAIEMFRMTEAETKEAYKDRSFPFESYAISLEGIVVNRLEFEIVFPDGFLVAPSPAVFYGQSSQIMHNRELSRVEFSFNNQRARCSVNDPLLGVSYLVYWMPPSQSRTTVRHDKSISNNS